MNNQTPPHPERDRLRKVFEFLKAYTELRYPPVRDVAQQLRILWLKDLPQHRKTLTSFCALRAPALRPALRPRNP
jgi:hypothetical protein